MYPHRAVTDCVTRHFVAARVHIKEKPETFKRFKVQWTPTILISDADGTEHHRIVGFLPVEDFVAQLGLGLGKADFAHGKYADAEQHFRRIVSEAPGAGAAPEAVYWAGVSAYKKTGSPEHLKAAGREIREKYPTSEWAKKVTAWVS